jgi:predicted nuclease of restriction endonuclease-like (RecB) superfamily
MKSIIKNQDYKNLIREIKTKIQTSQIKAHIKVNEELLKLYWEIGKVITVKQKNSSWGDGIIKQISKDLQTEFPNMKGFSVRNIKYMKQWFQFYSIRQQAVARLDNSNKSQILKDKENSIRQQVVAHLEESKSPQLVGQLNCNIFNIPWGHNIAIITKCISFPETAYYIQQTIQNNYSRSQLVERINAKEYQRTGKSVSNFKDKLPDIHSKLAIETLKNPYNFDFLSLRKEHDERELEDALMDNLSNFLIELGQGFAFVGRQYKLKVGQKDFKIDLLFYNIKLHSYVVIELKTVDFKPEFAGKLNFYVSAIDAEIKEKEDNPTIGLLICKSKDDTVVEYSFKDINKPIGISEYQLTKILPNEYKSSLPTIEEIEAELSAEIIEKSVHNIKEKI